MIFESKLPVKEFSDTTIYNVLFGRNQRFKAEQPCYIDAEDPSKLLTFGEVNTLILKFGAGLKRVVSDFKQGDVVAFYSTNELDYAAAIHGPIVVGGISTAIDASYDATKVAQHLETVQAKVLIASIETIDKALDAAKLVNIPVENIFIFGHQDYQGARSFNKAFLDSDELAIPIEYTPKELTSVPCFFWFTSGTTGKGKAVTMTHYSLTRAFAHKNTIDAFTHTLIRALQHNPFHHASALLLAMHVYLHNGWTTYILKNYSFEKMLSTIQVCKINFFFTFPWVVSALSKEPIVEKYDTSSLVFATCGGSRIEKSVIMAFHKRFRIPILNFYGMTEILGFLEPTFENTLAGELGCLSPGFSCKLVNTEGQEVGYNTIGELCIRGPTQTLGYHNNPQVNTDTFNKDGFVHTGDLVKMTEQGNLIYIDRCNDIIKYRLHKFAPQYIESVLMTHPLVSDCAVVGEYSEEITSWIPKGVVTLIDNKRDYDEIKQEILELIKSQLPDYMQLRAGLYIVRALPRTSTGKIERFKFKNNLAEWLY